jgi:hypothetical protein
MSDSVRPVIPGKRDPNLMEFRTRKRSSESALPPLVPSERVSVKSSARAVSFASGKSHALAERPRSLHSVCVKPVTKTNAKPSIKNQYKIRLHNRLILV